MHCFGGFVCLYVLCPFLLLFSFVGLLFIFIFSPSELSEDWFFFCFSVFVCLLGGFFGGFFFSGKKCSNCQINCCSKSSVLCFNYFVCWLKSGLLLSIKENKLLFCIIAKPDRNSQSSFHYNTDARNVVLQNNT